MAESDWPALPLEEWRETKDTLHMWTQIVGKIRLAHTPLINHYWNVPLYVSARGLTTSVVPHGERSFEMEFDFVDHDLVIRLSDGAVERVRLAPRTVADFYHELTTKANGMGIETPIWTMPVEVESPIRFERDVEHAAYDPDAASRFHRVLLSSDGVLTDFRSRFIGKVSPVHFFWGSFDLAVTRFSGRRAPEREEADAITREAYSHEVISHGFWPGSGDVPDAAFYSYTAPAPPGLDAAAIRPEGARWNPGTSGFIFMYEEMRNAGDPDAALMAFLESTYDAGADLAGWDRAALER
jgi:hypothetical protein